MITMLLGSIVVGAPIYVWYRELKERKIRRRMARSIEAQYNLVRLLCKLNINSAGEPASALFSIRRMRAEWRMMRGIGRP